MVMEGAAELFTGGEVLRCGGAGRRPPRRWWKTGELLDAGGVKRGLFRRHGGGWVHGQEVHVRAYGK